MSEPQKMNLRHEDLNNLVRAIVATRDEEIGCDDCFEEVDRYADMILDGKNAAEVLPLVKAHLEMCKGCSLEFEALVEALEAIK